MVLSISMIGCTGKMGKAILSEISARPDSYKLAGGATHGTSEELGNKLAGGLEVTSDLAAATRDANVVIDFSRPDMTMQLLDMLKANPKPVIVGTTGLSPIEQATIEKMAKTMPVLLSSNTSLGVNLLLGLVKQVAGKLGEEFDIEIIESHHRDKVDAPSGTAISLGKAAAEGRGVTFEKAALYNHTGKRTPGGIGFASIRGGDIVGEHNVIFAGRGERLELGHIATDRAIFARGALKAAEWLADKKSGFYTMQDALYS